MDQKQIEKRLTWLDEQHRKTTESIKGLSNLLSESRKTVEVQSKQIADLSDEIARLAGTTSRINTFDETLKQHRKEVNRQLEDAEKRRSEKETNLDALRKSDYQAVTQRVDQIQSDLQGISRLEEALEIRREEALRISKQADKIDKRTEKIDDTLSAMVDHIKSLARDQEKLNKAIQKTTSEYDALRKRVEESYGKQEVLADGNRSLDIRISELISSEAERAEGQARWIERQELSIVEFDNAWKKWGRRFDAIEQQASEFDERLAAYEELHRTLKQMRADLSELMERLERRITEVSEMQRLSDNRNKHDWSTFQAEDLKRWNTYKLTTDELWREHNRLHDQLSKQVEHFSEDLERAGQNITRLFEADNMRLGELLSMLREWINEVSDREG